MSQSASSPARRVRRRVILIGAIVLGVIGFVIMMGIAGPIALERIDASSGGIPTPDGFPADFPVYANASVSISSWDSTTSGGFIVWLSTGSKKEVIAYYNDALARGDWQSRSADPQRTQPQIPFRRASEPTYGGVITFKTNSLNGVTRISVEMKPDYWKAPSSSPTTAG
jgi:hypothetical protein